MPFSFLLYNSLYVFFINEIFFYIPNLCIQIYFLSKVHASGWTKSITNNKMLYVQILVSPTKYIYMKLGYSFLSYFFRILFVSISVVFLWAYYFRRILLVVLFCLGGFVLFFISCLERFVHLFFLV